MTAVSTVPLARASKEWASSSMAKTMPASGVLKAAEMPAAPPARTSARSISRRGRRSSRPMACMMEALTCTVGPSRPMEAPQSRPSKVSRTLPMAMREDSTLAMTDTSDRCREAMTCGMPLPCAPGNMRTVSSTESARPAGATIRLR